MLVVHKESEEKIYSVDLVISLLYVRLLHCHHFFLFLFECCLLYSLSPYSVVLSSFSLFFFTCISIVCACVFFNKQRPFFGLLNMRCLNILYKRYEVFFLSRIRTQRIRTRRKKNRRWMNNNIDMQMYRSNQANYS